MIIEFSKLNMTLIRHIEEETIYLFLNFFFLFIENHYYVLKIKM